jgi:uncharacterized membrane protein
VTESDERQVAGTAGPGKGTRFAVVRRAFRSFLGVPSAIAAGFILLAVATYALDHARIGWLGPVRTWMGGHVFGDPQSTGQLLGTIATGIITVTSITFSLLLLALQQAAASMTHQVFEQFLRRRLNQIYFGFFVGLALYALVILATVDPPYNPIYGATLALLLVIVALYLLLLMIYSTVTEMRPDAIVESIHDYTLRARKRQRSLLSQTHRERQIRGETARTIRSQRNGFVVGVDAAAVGRAIGDVGAPLEVVCLVPIGSYVAFADPIAAIHGERLEALDQLETTVRDAIEIDRARNLEVDPAYGLEQLENIAWTSISTSKQNPAPGLLVAENLRYIMAR